jgi:DNA-binding beta-propeller fold protein YncE
MQPIRSLLFFTCGLACLAFAADATFADDPPRQQGLRLYAGNLDNPSGVAVQPGTGDVFVAERRGVFRLTAPQPRGTAAERPPRRRFAEVNGFPTDVYGKGPMYDIGPLGVAFLDAKTLIVGDGSRPDGQELVYLFEVGDKPAEKPQKESAARQKLGPIPPSDESVSGEGNFYGVVIHDGACYITANGDDTKGWIARTKFADGKAGPLELYIATKVAVEVDAPVGITANDKGELVVGQMGEMTVPGDSLLTFYDAATGELKAKYETGLHDIAGVAYSPKTGKLYAVDFAWHDPSQGGLFELTVADGKVTTKKIFSLDKPTALAFDENGHLFVATFGTAEDGAKQKPGKVFRIGARRLTQAN